MRVFTHHVDDGFFDKEYETACAFSLDLGGTLLVEKKYWLTGL
jgi:hypothetical protein